MNIITNRLTTLAKNLITKSFQGFVPRPKCYSNFQCVSGHPRLTGGNVIHNVLGRALIDHKPLPLTNFVKDFMQTRQISLVALHRRSLKPRKKKNKKRVLGGKPFMKGVVLKILIKHPKKPNSANRKCCLVKLSNGKQMIAHIPGIGHNLQEHNIVLCRVGRLKDTPHVKIKCVRGKYDLPHVIKREN